MSWEWLLNKKNKNKKTIRHVRTVIRCHRCFSLQHIPSSYLFIHSSFKVDAGNVTRLRAALWLNPFLSAGRLKGCLDFTRSSLYLNILLHVPSWKTNKCHSQTGKKRLQTDTRNRRVGRRRRQSTYRCAICPKPRITGFVHTHTHTPPNDTRHDHPQPSSTFLNLNDTQEQFSKLKRKVQRKKNRGGSSVGIRMFSSSKKKKKMKKKKTNRHYRGASGKCLHVEFLFLLVFAEETVELLLCLATSFMVGGQ